MKLERGLAASRLYEGLVDVQTAAHRAVSSSVWEMLGKEGP